MLKKKAYISGGIEKVPNHKENFSRAEQLLAKDYIVLNPLCLPEGMARDDYMHVCLAMVEIADIVYMIDGWEESEGAYMEWLYAKSKNKKIVYEV